MQSIGKIDGKTIMIDYFFVFSKHEKSSISGDFPKTLPNIVSTLSLDASEEIGHVDLLVDHCTQF